MKNNKAFTLIELLVVIAVIGLLTTVVLVSLNGVRESGRDAKRQDDLGQIALAMDIYNGKNGNYPSTSGGENAIDSIENILSNVPQDPLGGDYEYTWLQAEGEYYCLYTKLESESDTYFCVSNQGRAKKAGSGYVPSNSDCCGHNLTGESGGGEWAACGDNITFTYNGSSVTYGTIESSTGECWLDRNLGASRVATAYNDTLAYGDYFQWGRLDDGHQVSTSATTSVISTTDVPWHDDFIVETSTTFYNWREPKNDDLWQGVSGTNNPCPEGWRVPSSTEWETEHTSWGSQDTAGAYGSPLKLTTAGQRYIGTGVMSDSQSYWSSTVSPDLSGQTVAYKLTFNDWWVGTSTEFRGNGSTVRCIKD